ncbi:serine hydrolase [Sphingomonas piscis]|uniref:serine hydrolase n=1 Tax=Sphingomonas piscis TaxID=2714943 RepID=UPI001FECEDC3|nr:serine hydrolase [Sphingomonas piscis]
MRFFAFLGLLLAVSAQPALAVTSPALKPVEQQLRDLVRARSGDYGIAALDLTTGETLSVRGDEPFPMASTMKIAVAALYLSQVEHGRRSLDNIIQGQSARSLMASMIIKSNNAATDILLNDLGGPDTLQDWIEQHRLSGMRVDRTIARLLAAKRDLYDLRDSSTPMAMLNMLSKLDKGELLRPANKQYLLGLMAKCTTGKNRMRALLPAGTRVEHKTGTLNGLTADVGFITLPDGRRIAVAFFARNGSDRPRTIAEAAWTVYYGFQARNTFRLQAASAPVTAKPASVSYQLQR